MKDSTLQTFNSKEAEVIYTRDMMDYEINVYGTEDEPLFLIRDIVEWLEYKDQKYSASKILELCDNSEKMKSKIRWEGCSREMWFVTEDGLYEICMRSQTEKAKKVRKFIKGILKELRTKGIVTNNNNNVEIANAMTMIAQSLHPIQQTLIKMQKENDDFKNVILEEHYQLHAKTQAIESTLNFLRIDGYELKTLTLAMANKRENQRKFFDELSEKYNARSSQISRVWDRIIYSQMYEFIGRSKLTPFENKSLHFNQSVKDITKSEYPKCIDFIDNFILDKIDFEERIKNNYGYRKSK